MGIQKCGYPKLFRYSKEIIGLQNCGIKNANIEIVVTQKFGGSQNLWALKICGFSIRRHSYLNG